MWPEEQIASIAHPLLFALVSIVIVIVIYIVTVILQFSTFKSNLGYRRAGPVDAKQTKWAVSKLRLEL